MFLADLHQQAQKRALQISLDSLCTQASSMPQYQDWCYNACSLFATKLNSDAERFQLCQGLLFSLFGG